MCGIVGVWRRGHLDSLLEVINRVNGLMENRGPDAEGVWLDEARGLAFGHRRLSIHDLSMTGSQPMESSCGRYILCFNGEVYNFKELKGEIYDRRNSAAEAMFRWRGDSDTEVLVEAISMWGVSAAVKKLNGMFAFSVWDKKQLQLDIVRDRFGEKPLFYGWVKDVFVFASEVRAFREIPGFSKDLCLEAVSLFMQNNCVPSPYSIYEGIYKLPPAHILTLKQNSRDVVLNSYWSIEQAARENDGAFSGLSDTEAVGMLEEKISRSVEKRMLADVSVGAFLSGGIDSSTIVSLMQNNSTLPVKTFSIGFESNSYNEAHNAKKIAQHLGTDHTELYLTPNDAISVIPDLPDIYDEPFADSSQIPTFIVSKLAKKSVTVALTGDGGDELFGGYVRHIWADKLWRNMSMMPYPIRSLLGSMLTAVSPEVYDSIFERVKEFLPSAYRQNKSGDKLHKLSRLLSARTPMEMYCNLTSHWQLKDNVVKGGLPLSVHTSIPCSNRPVSQLMMDADLKNYFLNDILVKVDKASMAVSLEARVPLLDNSIVDFSFGIPLSMKIRNGSGKWVLKQVLRKHLPDSLIDRPKWGFGLPLDEWMRLELREWCESLLSEECIKDVGYFDPKLIRRKWKEHLSGARNWQYHLWDVLMFHSWFYYNK